MAVGFRAPGPLGLSNPTTAAVGYRGLLAFWCGGASSLAPTGAAGVHSLLAPWLGGAGVPNAGTSGYRSMLAHWLGGAGVEAFTPEPEPPASDSLDFIGDRVAPYTQRARLYPFERPDEFGFMFARGVYRATSQPYRQADRFGNAAAAAIYRGQLIATPHVDEFATLIARRGLPNKTFMDLFMAELYYQFRKPPT